MAWTEDVAHLFGGAFLANAIPHLAKGLAGERFPTPFARSPGVGTSPPWVNALWGLVNLGVGYLLACGMGTVSLGLTRWTIMVGVGFWITALGLALWFGRVRKR
ncbi:MAG: hypothetical protein NZ951_00310 [Dehalococcoidia bacterium]|nr:hypothetical protein [Dehalococcoidia bacterium]MDW8119088.1 hypothetical protein [Chloroflexota bacterium]